MGRNSCEFQNLIICVFFSRALDAYRTEYAYSIEITPSASKQAAPPSFMSAASFAHRKKTAGHIDLLFFLYVSGDKPVSCLKHREK